MPAARKCGEAGEQPAKVVLIDMPVVVKVSEEPGIGCGITIAGEKLAKVILVDDAVQIRIADVGELDEDVGLVDALPAEVFVAPVEIVDDAEHARVVDRGIARLRRRK